MPIKVVGLHHANVRLQTPEQALDFYGRVLGLERDPSLPYDPERPNFWWNIGTQGTQLHTPSGPNPLRATSGQGIGQHFALMVEDVEEAKRILAAEGIRYDELQVPGRGLQLFLQDPAGNTIELFQAPDTRP